MFFVVFRLLRGPKHRCVQIADVSWPLVGGLILVGVGAIVLVKGFFLREE